VAKDVDARDILHLLLKDFYVDFMVAHKVWIVKQENTKDFLKIIR
jgi:hypothetical protein